MPEQTRKPPEHAPQTAFKVVDNQLMVGDESVSALGARADGRAFYAYDSTIINRNVRRLLDLLPEGVSLHYAMKANPMPEVVGHLAGLTRGLDVASAAELRVALAAGVKPRDISFAGPGKSEEDLSAALNAGVVLVLESPTEAARAQALAEKLGRRAPVAIRVNPDFQLKASGMQMGGGPQPFGIDAEQVPELLASLRDSGLDVLGFHIFSGSQNLRPESIIEAHRETLQLAARLASHLPGPLRWLNIGGGLGVPYFPGEKPLDAVPIMAHLAEQLRVHASLLADTEVVMELGRYLVAEAGIYACRITDRKVSRGTTYLVTNGGLHHYLSVTGNFGQVIRKNYPVAVANRVQSEALETVSVVGPLCTPLDLIASNMQLPRADIGDWIAVYMSGAYGFTASPHGFLSHPKPLEFFI